MRILLAFIIVAFIFVSQVPARASGLYVMAEHYPPYSFLENGKPAGFFVELFRMIEDKLGENPVKINFYPWARAYKKLKRNRGDVLFPMAMNEERKKLFKFVGPVFLTDIYFYKKKGNWIRLGRIDDAKKVGKIGVTRDDLFHQKLVGMGFKNLEVSTSQRSDFFKVQRERVDLVPMGDRTIGLFLDGIPELGMSDFEQVGPVIFTSSAYIAFSSTVPDEVVSKWQAALDELKAEGEWLRIIDKYFPPDQAK
ncbi:substrate-binding periplasmic protein [Maridesulfovibrio sp.]|uniref:substrate-binding periplasmic protein n=1 Tax=Maridesulfovibrio sp. TaxID=2795000 RepID=UPI003BA8EE74